MEQLSCRWPYTISIFLLWFNIGIATSIEGPTLLDLKILYNTTYEAISSAVGCRGLGVIVGALITGVVVDMFKDKRLLILEASQLVFAASIIMMPFVKFTPVLSVLFLAIGVSNGATQVASSSLLLDLWKERSAEMMPVCQVIDRIAVFITPLAVNPFLAQLKFPSNVDSQTDICRLRQNITKRLHVPAIIVGPTHVKYGYLCAGAAILIMSVPLILTHLFVNRQLSNYIPLEDEAETKSSLKELLNPASYANGSLMLGSFMVWILSLVVFNVGGAYFISLTFIRSFAVEFYHFPRDKASFLLFLLEFSSFIGCILASILARKIPVKLLFAVYNVLSLPFIILMRFGSSPISLYIATSAVGLSIFALGGHLIPVANTQIETGGVVIGLLTTVKGLSAFVYVWLLGYQIDIHGPRSFIDMFFNISTAGFLYTAIFLFVAFKHGNRQNTR